MHVIRLRDDGLQLCIVCGAALHQTTLASVDNTTHMAEPCCHGWLPWLRSPVVLPHKQLAAHRNWCCHWYCFCAGAGAASLYVPRYIAEVSPPALRGWLGSLNQVCRCQLVSVGVDWDGCWHGIQVLGVSASVLGRAYVSRAYVYCLLYSSWLIPWQ